LRRGARREERKTITKDPAESYVFDTSALLPLQQMNITPGILEAAIEIKATNSLSVCDSWIAATALATESILVHKDPEFEQLKNIVKLKSLPYKPSPVREAR
jgi:predicted nucleic acid-binding protein